MCLRQGGGECGRHHTVEHFVRDTDFEVVVLDKLSYASKGYDRLRDSGVFHLIQTYCVDLASALPPGLVCTEAETRTLVLQLALEGTRTPLYSAVSRCTPLHSCPLVFTRCSECSARYRPPGLRLAHSARRLVYELEPDRVAVILHIAAETHVDNSIDSPVPFVENNVKSTLTMLSSSFSLA